MNSTQQISLIELCDGLKGALQILAEMPGGTEFIYIEKDHPIVYWSKSQPTDGVGETAYIWNGVNWEPSDDGAVTNNRLNHSPYVPIASLQQAVESGSTNNEKEPFKVIIRVVKSIGLDNSIYNPNIEYFGNVDIAREPLIYAKNKDEVKKIIAEKYPQFFPEAKVFSKETKDDAQFFYALIYPLYEYEKSALKSGQWVCNGCGQKHENEYLSYPRIDRSLGSSYKFCRSEEDICLEMFRDNQNKNADPMDNHIYIRPDSPTHIYKITEKGTGKCYIGKTREAPFFRWWNHLTKSSSPFGEYFRTTDISNWTFEVLETLSWDTPDTEVFKIETRYILELNSIENGFNKVVSSKAAASKNLDLLDKLEPTQPLA